MTAKNTWHGVRSTLETLAYAAPSYPGRVQPIDATMDIADYARLALSAESDGNLKASAAYCAVWTTLHMDGEFCPDSVITNIISLIEKHLNN